MAIITLRQLLHRPAPGGPISANDPLPVRLYGPNGQPISQQTPLDVRDQQLRDFLGSVHDEESDALKVALTGRNVVVTQLANALEVTPGATVRINHNPQNPVTAYSLLVEETFRVAHSFTVRLIEWVVKGNTSRYWFEGIASTTATTITQRFPKKDVVGGAGTFELRITNNDASSRFYDAFLTTWGV